MPIGSAQLCGKVTRCPGCVPCAVESRGGPQSCRIRVLVPEGRVQSTWHLTAFRRRARPVLDARHAAPPPRSAAPVAAAGGRPPAPRLSYRSATSSTTRSSTRAGGTTAPAACGSAPGGHYDTYPARPVATVRPHGRPIRFPHSGGAPARRRLSSSASSGRATGSSAWTRCSGSTSAAGTTAAWKAFAGRLRYRIVERSSGLGRAPAPAARAAGGIGPLESCRSVAPHAARRPLRRARRHRRQRSARLPAPPQAGSGHASGAPPSVFVVPTLAGQRPRPRRAGGGDGRPRASQPGPLPRGAACRSRGVRAGLTVFVRRHYPELFDRRRAAPRPTSSARGSTTLLRNAARLYEHADALWIDYGELREFHRRAPGITARVRRRRRARGAGVYDDPGRDDITFLVDFSAAMAAARDGGWRVAYYGPQAELARRTRVALDPDAVELIVRHRALRWMLALAGVGPERSWQRAGRHRGRATPHAGRVPVRRYVEQSVREFRDQRGTLQTADHPALATLAHPPRWRQRREPAQAAQLRPQQARDHYGYLDHERLRRTRRAAAVARAHGDHRLAVREAERLSDTGAELRGAASPDSSRRSGYSPSSNSVHASPAAAAARDCLSR